VLTCVIAFKLGLFVGMNYSLVHVCKTVSMLYLRLTFAKQMLTSCEISIESCRLFPWNVVYWSETALFLQIPEDYIGISSYFMRLLSLINAWSGVWLMEGIRGRDGETSWMFVLNMLYSYRQVWVLFFDFLLQDILC